MTFTLAAVALVLLVVRPWRSAARDPVSSGAPPVAATAVRRPSPAIRRRRRTSTGDPVAAALPEVVDLLRLGAAAGRTPRATLAVVERWLPAAIRVVVADALAQADRGRAFVDAIDAATAPLGDAMRPLVAAIAAAERDPHALRPALERLADLARHDRRVAVQTRARRLPVVTLVPLVVCVLPAFGLLTVAPLVIDAIDGLRAVP